jgi:hypothetical protein
MYSSTYLNWFRRLLILGALVAGLTASAAGAAVESRAPYVSDVPSSIGSWVTPYYAKKLKTSGPGLVPGSIGSWVGTGFNPSWTPPERKVSPALAAALSATPATVVSRPPDVQDAADVQNAAAALHTMVAGPEAAGLQAYPAPDPATTALERHFQHEDALYGLKSTPSLPGIAPTWEQAMAQHPTPALSPGDRVDLIVSTWEQAIAQHTTPALSPGDRIDLIVSQERGQAQSTLVSRPPDVSDAAQVAASVSTVHGNGFDWNDWAIGIGTGLGLALLLGGGIMVGRQLRHRVQPA